MAKIEQKIFGKIAKVLRASNFLTLKAAGAKANICTSAFYNFETELRAPNYSKQIEIAEAFRIPKELFDELWNLTKGLNENLNKKDENDELITLQTIAYRVLNHYLIQANIPENLTGINALSNDTPPIPTDNNFSRIMKVLEKMNFINPTPLAKKANIDIHVIGYIKSKRISTSKDTLARIAEILGLTYGILTQLRELEKKLEEYLETRTDIERERKELLILQALSHALLDYYYRQASTNNNHLKKLYTRKK